MPSYLRPELGWQTFSVLSVYHQPAIGLEVGIWKVSYVLQDPHVHGVTKPLQVQPLRGYSVMFFKASSCPSRSDPRITSTTCSIP